MSSTSKKAYVFEMNLISANIFSLILFLVAAIITVFVFGGFDFFNSPFIYTKLILYFCLHEAFHGIGYIIGGCNPKKVSFGVLLEKGIFYCMCYQEITKKNILISLQMPFTFLSIITYIIAVIFHLPFLGFLSVINFMGASMDMAMFAYISRIKNVTYSESGAPNEFVLISDEDLSKKKNIFLRLKEVKDYKKEDYEFTKFKIFNCSKTSFYIMLFVIGLDIVSFLLG